jgi:V8-like Glu-specific endopeptidase
MKKCLTAFFLFAFLPNAEAQDTCHTYAYQKEVLSTNVEPPYNFVCHVITDRKKKFWFGSKEDGATFTFISPKVIIGAYHAIMQVASKIRSIEIDLYAHEENGKPAILKKIELDKKEFSLTKPFSPHGIKNDCGLIILNNPITDLPKDFPKLITFNAAKTLSEYFHISGYPYEKNNREYNSTRLWERKVFFNNVSMTDNVVYYPCVKTSEGDSGGPIWLMKDNQTFLFGTHVGGNPSNYNSLWGECFDEEKIKVLTKILEDNK